MGAAFTLWSLATFCLGVAFVALALYGLWLLAKWGARKIQHEMVMRPQERYFTM